MKKTISNREMKSQLISLFAPHKTKLVCVGVCMAVAIVTGFFQPLIVQRITDRGMYQKNLHVVITSVLFLLLLVVVENFLNLCTANIFAKIHNNTYSDIYKKAFSKILRLESKYFNDKNSSEILSTIQMDVNATSLITDQYVINCISSIFKVISGLIGLIIISWKLTIFVIVFIPIKYAIVRFFARKKECKISETIEINRTFSSWFDDIVRGISEIKLWNLYAHKNCEFDGKQEKILENKMSTSMLNAWNSSFESLLELVFIGSLYIFGTAFIMDESLTIGGVFAFLTYSSYVTNSIGTILNIKYFFAQITPSANRLHDFMKCADEYAKKHSKADVKTHDIRFSNILFAYERQILNNINLFIKSGEKVAIIGPNGSGKSTLTNLLLRLIEPDKGEIYLGNMNIDEIDIDQYRSLFSVVRQNPHLFNDTIINNIKLGSVKNNAEVEKVCQLTGLDKVAERLSEKGDTYIGINGSKLSGGEKQKIAVARALLKNAPIVILDEATTGYDNDSYVFMQKIIEQEMTKNTVIIITHRYEHLHKMDCVYELSNGEITRML